MVLQAALTELGDDASGARELVEKALQDAEQANVELHELAQGILPHALTGGGLQSCVRAVTARMPMPVTVNIPATRFAPGLEATAYFVINEALTNVVKHAHASHATVTAVVDSGQLNVEVADDRIGGANAVNGLVGLDDRVSALGGCLAVKSPKGKGTRIIASLPLQT
jgi:signal transduction histidine kinase